MRPRFLRRSLCATHGGTPSASWRSPTKDNDTLQNFPKPTTPPWSDFGVRHPADPTLKGALLMQRMGSYYRKRWAALFEPDACPNRAFFWADRDERTLMTARSARPTSACGAPMRRRRR